MKLKTLKDIKCICCGDEMFHNVANCEREQLKQEAIKWVKEFRDKDNIILTNDLPITDSKIERYDLDKLSIKPLIFWIKIFFNISEEELK